MRGFRFRVALVFIIAIPVWSYTQSARTGGGKPSSASSKRTESLQEKDRDANAHGDEGEDIVAREKYYHDRRAGGAGKSIPSNAYARSVAQKIELASKTKGRTILSALPPWQSLNAGGMAYTSEIYVSGRANSLAFHPTDPNIMYLATADGGATWMKRASTDYWS